MAGGFHDVAQLSGVWLSAPASSARPGLTLLQACGVWITGGTSAAVVQAPGLTLLQASGVWITGAVAFTPEPEPEPTPADETVPSYANPVRPLRYIQRATILPSWCPDEYGWLVARARLRSQLQPLSESQFTEVLYASSSIKASIVGELAPEEIISLAFKRGLPNRALLALLLAELDDD